MIIDITSRCNGNCTHCMSRCTTNGIDMPNQVWEDSIEFIKKLDVNVINIGGGEPTLHPYFIKLTTYMRQQLRGKLITVCSNGTFVRNPDLYSYLKKSGMYVQVTYKKDLYKTDLTKEELDKLQDFALLELNEPSKERLVSYGRALDNDLETSSTRISPFCFNIRSLIKISGMSFYEAVKYLESRNKFCCPGISPDGSITLSESLCCPTVGTIYDSFGKISNNIKNFHCAKCVYAKKMLNNPDTRYREVFYNNYKGDN